MTAATISAWLLTYLLHSTALLGAAFLLSALLGSRRLAAQETLLRTALLGGVVTATLSLALGAGGLSLGPAPPAAFPRLAEVSRTAIPAPPTNGTSLTTTTAITTPPPDRQAPTHPLATLVGAVPWSALLLGLWIVGAGTGLIRLAAASRSLRALLADRRPLPPGRLVRRLAAALGLTRPVRLSLSGRIAVPFAVGVSRPEVCVPERTLDDLSPRQREALIAHELAHHARRDPVWLGLGRALQAVLFVQPLNRVVARRLRGLAECRCDDAAVRTTGRPLDLARCLVEVAQWAAAPPEAVAALSAGTGLSRRVERLLSATPPQGPASRWLAPCLALAVAALGVLLPGVDLGAARPVAAAIGVTIPVDDPPPTPEPAPPAATAAPRAPEAPAQPAPDPRPAPAARPAPPALPDATLEGLEQQLQELVQRVSDRVDRHESELDRLERAIEALTNRLEPHTAEMERLGEEVERLTVQQLHEVDPHLSAEAQAAAERQLREVEAQVRGMVAGFKPSTEEIERLAAEARALAEASRPTAEERAEIERLTRELAEQAKTLAPSAEEARELARKARDLARAEVEAHREEIERAVQEARKLALERADADRQRAEREAARDRRSPEELERQAEEELRQEAGSQPTPTPSGGGS